ARPMGKSSIVMVSTGLSDSRATKATECLGGSCSTRPRGRRPPQSRALAHQAGPREAPQHPERHHPLRSESNLLSRVVGEPPVERGRSYTRVAAGHQRLVIKLDAVEVAPGITNRHLARILVIFKDSGDQFIDIED